MKKFTLSIIAMICAVFAMNAELYIVGDMNSWSFQKMDEPEPNVYTWQGDFHAGNTFKFPLESGKWAPCYTPKWENGVGPESNESVNAGETYQVYLKDEDAWPDNKFVMAQDGNYTVTVNLNDNTMVCTLHQDVVVLPDLFIVGGDTPAGWNPQNGQSWKMTRDGNTYTLTVLLTKNTGGADKTRFVFLTGTEWWPRYISATAGNAPLENIETGVEYPIMQATGDRDSAGFTVKYAGIYKITITLADENNGVMKLEYAPLSIIGPAMNGWVLDSAPALDINSDGSYTFTGDFNSGEFRINSKGDWWPSFVMKNANNGNTPIAAEGGSYDLMWSAGEPPSMKFAEEGNYTLNLNVSGNAPTLSVIRNSNHVEEPLTELYIVGDALNGKGEPWQPMEDFRRTMEAGENPGEFIYCQHFYPGQFKFLEKANSWDPGLGATIANQEVADGGTYPLTSTANGDHKFVIPEEGTYTVTAYTFGDDKHITVAYGGIHTGIEGIAGNAATLCINGRTISANGAVEIYDTMGRKIGATENGSITLPAAGIYVAVTGNKAIKIAVK